MRLEKRIQQNLFEFDTLGEKKRTELTAMEIMALDFEQIPIKNGSGCSLRENRRRSEIDERYRLKNAGNLIDGKGRLWQVIPIARESMEKTEERMIPGVNRRHAKILNDFICLSILRSILSLCRRVLIPWIFDHGIAHGS
jgi:hypothetical protein